MWTGISGKFTTWLSTHAPSVDTRTWASARNAPAPPAPRLFPRHAPLGAGVAGAVVENLQYLGRRLLDASEGDVQHGPGGVGAVQGLGPGQLAINLLRVHNRQAALQNYC